MNLKAINMGYGYGIQDAAREGVKKHHPTLFTLDFRGIRIRNAMQQSRHAVLIQKVGVKIRSPPIRTVNRYPQLSGCNEEREEARGDA